MSDRRRPKRPGATLFFTVARVRQQRPLAIDAVVVLPDRLPCVWNGRPATPAMPGAGVPSNRGSPAACTTAETSQLSIFKAAMNADCGISTLPNWRIFFLPAFCFSRSLRLRVASPP